jgi:hypothetical protein
MTSSLLDRETSVAKKIVDFVWSIVSDTHVIECGRGVIETMSCHISSVYPEMTTNSLLKVAKHGERVSIPMDWDGKLSPDHQSPEYNANRVPMETIAMDYEYIPKAAIDKGIPPIPSMIVLSFLYVSQVDTLFLSTEHGISIELLASSHQS